MFNPGGGGQPRGFGFGGFSIGSGAGPRAGGPRKSVGVETQLAQMGYGVAGMAGRSYGGHLNIGKRRVKSEEEYFEDDDEQNAEDLEYQPAPDSPVLNRDAGGGSKDSDSDDSDDPLEAFMAGIEEEVRTQD